MSRPIGRSTRCPGSAALGGCVPAALELGGAGEPSLSQLIPEGFVLEIGGGSRHSSTLLRVPAELDHWIHCVLRLVRPLPRSQRPSMRYVPDGVSPRNERGSQRARRPRL